MMPKGKHQNHVRGEDHPQVRHWKPPAPEANLRVMYLERVMSQQEIAAALGVTLKRVQTAFRRFGIETRPRIKRDQRGVKNHLWRGDAAGYAACHMRVERARGKPLACEWCGTDDEDELYEWANLSGNYPDPDDYERMCRSCHRCFDSARREVMPHA